MEPVPMLGMRDYIDRHPSVGDARQRLKPAYTTREIHSEALGTLVSGGAKMWIGKEATYQLRPYEEAPHIMPPVATRNLHHSSMLPKGVVSLIWGRLACHPVTRTSLHHSERILKWFSNLIFGTPPMFCSCWSTVLFVYLYGYFIRALHDRPSCFGIERRSNVCARFCARPGLHAYIPLAEITTRPSQSRSRTEATTYASMCKSSDCVFESKSTVSKIKQPSKPVQEARLYPSPFGFSSCLLPPV